MRINLFLLSLLLFFIFKTVNCFSEEIKFINFDRDLQCIHITIADYNKKFIINTKQEYDNLLQFKGKYGPCKNFKLPYIDFSKYTLIGLFALESGCETQFFKKIVKNKNKKNYIYELTSYSKGPCELAWESMNWVLIPKIPEKYSVKFKYKHKYDP